MHLVKFLFVYLFIVSTISAQFSIENFLNKPMDLTITVLKDSLRDKKFEEKELMNFKAIVFGELFELISVNVGFMFNSDGKQIGKVITNKKEDDSDADLLFNKLKGVLVKKYGEKYTENSLMGLSILLWKTEGNTSVMLNKKSAKTILTILRN